MALVAGGLAIGTGILIAASAPSCGDEPDGEAPFDELIGDAACRGVRAHLLVLGGALAATGGLAMLFSLRGPAAASAPADKDDRPIAERLRDQARADARAGRCDRARILAARLDPKTVDADAALRACLR